LNGVINEIPKIAIHLCETKLWTSSLGKGAKQRANQSVYLGYVFKLVEEVVAGIVGISMENQKLRICNGRQHKPVEEIATGIVGIFVENQQPPLHNMEVTCATSFRNIVKVHVIESTLADITKIICLKQCKIWGKQKNGTMNIYTLCHVRVTKSLLIAK